MFQSFDDVLEFLDSLGLFNMDFELDRMRRAIVALDICGDGWNPYIVQVIGTNGKGSTATFLASIASAHGLKTGLYTSPHFVTPRERIQINGRMIDAEPLVHLANDMHEKAPDLTYFEFLTALALLAFKEEKTEFVVLEAGLGGRYDATTAMPTDSICYVPIDLDHMKILGNTITEIATDKSGAMRNHCDVLTGIQSKEAMDVIRTSAQKNQCTFFEAEQCASLPVNVQLGLAGPHQKYNALLALAAWNRAVQVRGWNTEEALVRKGLAQAHIAGRFQHIPACHSDPAFILDGGHNPHGLRSCMNALDEEKIRPSAMIFSCLADKDYATMLPMVMHMSRDIPLLLCTIQDNERALVCDELAYLCEQASQQSLERPSSIIAEPRLATAITHATQIAQGTNRPILICGSLYLLGEFFTLKPQWLETTTCI